MHEPEVYSTQLALLKLVTVMLGKTSYCYPSVYFLNYQHLTKKQIWKCPKV